MMLIRVTQPVIQVLELSTACCGAARGASMITTSAPRIGSGALLTIPITSLVSVAPARFLDSGILFPVVLKF
jgi:hypothetical protein